MTPITDKFKDLIHALKRLAHLPDRRHVRAELENVRAEDLAEAVSRLETDEAVAVLQAMEVEQAAEVMVEMPTETAKTIVSELPDDVVAAYMDVLPMDDALELNEELPPERFEALLKVIPTEDADEIRRLLAYPEGSVGRIMTERFFEVKPTATMAEIIEDLRSAPDDKYESINDVYVLDDQRRLAGVISLRRVLRTDPDLTAEEVMRRETIACVVDEDEEAAARTVARYGLYALPVVDREGRMVGLFTGDDAQDILEEADTEDHLALGAVSGEAEPYMSLNVFQLYKRRVPWLVVLFAAEFLTGAVLRHYGKGDDARISTADVMLFVPLLLGAGGNSGSQVTTTITRALALGEIRGRDSLTVLVKELTVASMVGASIGLLGFGRAVLPSPFGWGSSSDLSLVVGLALPAIILWSATVASLLPIGAKKLGADPAVMSAPFITTLVDATGLVIYFEIALRLLR